jgi:hypothetical protein
MQDTFRPSSSFAIKKNVINQYQQQLHWLLQIHGHDSQNISSPTNATRDHNGDGPFLSLKHEQLLEITKF